MRCTQPGRAGQGLSRKPRSRVRRAITRARRAAELSLPRTPRAESRERRGTQAVPTHARADGPLACARPRRKRHVGAARADARAKRHDARRPRPRGGTRSWVDGARGAALARTPSADRFPARGARGRALVLLSGCVSRAPTARAWPRTPARAQIDHRRGCRCGETGCAPRNGRHTAARASRAGHGQLPPRL